MKKLHPCPGGCGTSVPYSLLACGPCWRMLPDELRRAVNIAWSRRTVDPAGHRAAVADAKAWYRGRRRK